MRTSSARYLVPVGFAVAVLFSFQGGWTGTGWNDALRAAVNHSWFIAVVVGAAASLDSYRYRRTEPVAMTSSRGLAPALVPMAAVASWGIAAVLIILLTAVAATAAVSTWRTPELLLAAVACGWMVELAGIGWFVGWWLPFFISVPVMLLTGWLVSVTLAADTDGWSAVFSGIDDGIFTASIVPNTPVLAAQLIVFVTLGLVVCAMVRVTSIGFIESVVGLLAVVAAMAVATSLLQAGPARRLEVREAAGPRVCNVPTATAAAVCAWPDDTAAQQVAAQQAAAMWTPLVAAGVRAPAGVVDEGLAAPPDWITSPLWSSDRQNIADNLSMATVVWLWCGAGSNRADAGEDLYARQLWLQMQVKSIDAGYYTAELELVLKTSPTEQVQWLSTRPTQARCSNR